MQSLISSEVEWPCEKEQMNSFSTELPGALGKSTLLDMENPVLLDHCSFWHGTLHQEDFYIKIIRVSL